MFWSICFPELWLFFFFCAAAVGSVPGREVCCCLSGPDPSGLLIRLIRLKRGHDHNHRQQKNNSKATLNKMHRAGPLVCHLSLGYVFFLIW